MNFNELIFQLSINDILFLLIQIVLAYCVFYSIYQRRFKSIVQSWVTRFRLKVNEKKRRALSWLKMTKAKLVNRFRQKRGHHRLVVVGSIANMSINGNARISVNRGESSWEYFALAWTVLSVFIIEANGLYSSLQVHDYSILVLVADLVAITYLCFVSSWFRNKVIWIVNLRNKTPD